MIHIFKLGLVALPWLIVGLVPTVGLWIAGAYLVLSGLAFIAFFTGFWMSVINWLKGKELPAGGCMLLSFLLACGIFIWPWLLGKEDKG